MLARASAIRRAGFLSCQVLCLSTLNIPLLVPVPGAALLFVYDVNDEIRLHLIESLNYKFLAVVLRRAQWALDMIMRGASLGTKTLDNSSERGKTRIGKRRRRERNR
jgi:hypothetical protein